MKIDLPKILFFGGGEGHGYEKMHIAFILFVNKNQQHALLDTDSAKPKGRWGEWCPGLP